MISLLLAVNTIAVQPIAAPVPTPDVIEQAGTIKRRLGETT
jgi:hypothetical protein